MFLSVEIGDFRSPNSPRYKRLFQRVESAQRYHDVSNLKVYVWKQTASHSSKVAGVASYSLLLEIQFN